MRIVMIVVGLLALAAGLLWAGQGLGYIDWPKPQPGQFTMVNHPEWIYYGGTLAIVGLIILWRGMRRR